MNFGTSFAFKLITEASKSERPDEIIFQTVTNEVAVLAHPLVRRHPNIVQLQGICWDISDNDDKPWPVLVFEKFDLGDLSTFTESSLWRILVFSQCVKLCLDIGIALLDMHSHGTKTCESSRH